MATGAVALSAWCCFLAARRLVASTAAAAVAGLVYGFSRAMVAQSLRHPHVTLAMFPPLAIGDPLPQVLYQAHARRQPPIHSLSLRLVVVDHAAGRSQCSRSDRVPARASATD